jgi:hypothetical protein
MGDAGPMWLLDKMLKKLIRTGQLTITDHDGKVYRYGNGTGEEIRVRLTHRKAARHIATYPQVGAGEAYMWGWLEVEAPHDIRDMVLYVTEQSKRSATRRSSRRRRSRKWSSGSPPRSTASIFAARRARTPSTPTT